MRRKINAVMYGAGHRGIAAILTLGVRMVLDAPFETTAPALYLLGILENLCMAAVHISLSIFCRAACVNRKRLILFPAAILLHALFEAATMVSNSLFGLLAAMNVLMLITLGIVSCAVCVWRSETESSDICG